MIGALGAAVAILLLLSGPGKLRDAAPTVAAVRAVVPRAGRRWARVAVRATGMFEIAAGIGFLATGARIAALTLAVLYLGFTGVAVRLLRAPDRPACGCFGRHSAPVSVMHVGLDVVATGVAVAAAVRPPGPGAGLFDRAPAAAVAAVALTGLLAAVTLLVVTALPALAAARARLTEGATR